jgi:putative hydrolase of HD superfamily
MDRLEKQLKFIYEIDKVKSIVRKTRLFHTDRYENDAEHSWHICMMASILNEYSNDDIDISRVIKMMLIHDLVEIDTDDKIVYNKTETDAILEEKAARRIFGLLPGDQASEYYNLWVEFEEQKTHEAKFAMSLDRMEPLLQNLYRGGEDWIRNGISYDQVISVNRKIEKGSKQLWDFIKGKIDECMKDGGFECE